MWWCFKEVGQNDRSQASLGYIERLSLEKKETEKHQIDPRQLLVQQCSILFHSEIA